MTFTPDLQMGIAGIERQDIAIADAGWQAPCPSSASQDISEAIQNLQARAELFSHRILLGWVGGICMRCAGYRVTVYRQVQVQDCNGRDDDKYTEDDIWMSNAIDFKRGIL